MCCLFVICFVSFAVCYFRATCFMFLLIVLCCLVVLYDLISILCVLCFCIVLCIVYPHLDSCFFYICVQVYWPLPTGGNPIAVNKYHISLHVYCNTDHRNQVLNPVLDVCVNVAASEIQVITSQTQLCWNVKSCLANCVLVFWFITLVISQSLAFVCASIYRLHLKRNGYITMLGTHLYPHSQFLNRTPLT